MREILAKSGNQLITHPLESICDSFFVFYSLLTLLWIASYFANLPFSAIPPIFFLLLPLSVLALAFKPPAIEQRTPSIASEVRRDTLIVLFFIIAGVSLTLFLHRPDADDEMFLGMAVSLLADADQPLQQLPGYRSGFYAITAYEPLKAMVSYTTGLPLLDSYYVVVPALTSALTVVVTYQLLRELVPAGWIIGMLFFFVVMLAWGDVHRTLANFGFVRMFQGKSVLVSAIVPAIVLYFFLIRYGIHTRYHVFLLASVVVSGIGFSRGGFIIGPLLVLTLTLASIKLRSSRQSSTKIFIVATVSAAALLLLSHHYGWNLNPSQLVHTNNGAAETTTNWEMYGFTMGYGFRGIFLLACVGAGFLFVKDKDVRYSYRNFLAIFFPLLLIPWTSNFFAKTLHAYLAWRWMWILPVPALASVAVGGAFAYLRRAGNSVVALGVFLAIAIGFTAASPIRVLSRVNYTSLRWPSAKLGGDSVYLRPQKSTAVVKNGKLHLEGYEKGF